VSKPEEDAPQVGQRFKPSTERCPNPRFLDDGTNIKRVETVEDRDDILAPILEEIMRDAAREQGIIGRG